MDTLHLTEQELDRLEELLADPAFKDEAMTLDTLQGFLCAVVSAPEDIPRHVWVAEALGAEPQYSSAQQEQETLALLTKLHDSIASALSNGEDFDLILYGLEDNPEELDYAPWCDGYVYGTQIGELNWFETAGEFAEDLSEKMEIFFLLNGLLKEDARKHKEPWLSAKEEARAIAQAQDALPGTIGDVYRFWQARRSTTQPLRRAAPKIGRNDPCPCGSGKKFKQCCGKEPTLH